jgi:two-component system chemotaxis response regulator CheY
MSETVTILLVDPDARARALLAKQLQSVATDVVQASDGATALDVLKSVDVKVVVTELYLPTGDHACLVQAIRSNPKLRRTRAVAHTHRCLPPDREWAMTAGADAYLIKPTRAERMRYVVSRLATVKGRNASVPETRSEHIVRRDSLDAALAEVEAGTLTDTSSIVFGRAWWQELPKAQQSAFRRRARQARISLRSDSLMKNHFVEIRGSQRNDVGLSSEQPESPYRR